VQQANAKGHPDYPLSDDELLAKFNANVSYAGLSRSATSRLVGQIMTIDDIKDMIPLPDSLNRSSPDCALR
jgi:hypothetical protein